MVRQIPEEKYLIILETIIDILVSFVYFGNYKYSNSFLRRILMTKTAASDRQEREKLRILRYSLEVFLKDGFYKTTMDELAEGLQISKKTIYKYFPSKEMLVTEAVGYLKHHIEIDMTELLSQETTSIGRLKVIVEFIGRISMNVSERTISELQRQLPEIWNSIDEFRTRMMTKNLMEIIRLGKKEGYVKDYPEEVIITMFISAIRGVINPTVLINNKCSFRDAVSLVFDILISGVMTESGKQNFTKEKKNIKYGILK